VAVKITFEVTKTIKFFGKFSGTFDAHLPKGIKFNPCTVKMDFTDQNLAECLITLETKMSRLLEYDDLSLKPRSGSDLSVRRASRLLIEGMGWLEPTLWKRILADLANPSGFQTGLPLDLPLKNELVRTPTIHTVMLADQDHRRGSLKPRRTSDTDALQLRQCLAYIINGAVFEGSMREYWENLALKTLREIPAIKQVVSAIREFEPIGGRRPFSGLGFTIRGFKLR
jgi:hypothetical protein